MTLSFPLMCAHYYSHRTRIAPEKSLNTNEYILYNFKIILYFDKTNWKKCVIFFSPQTLSFRYTFGLSSTKTARRRAFSHKSWQFFCRCCGDCVKCVGVYCVRPWFHFEWARFACVFFNGRTPFATQHLVTFVRIHGTAKEDGKKKLENAKW